MPIYDENKNEFIINWPEYAGEQWDRIFSTRSVSEKWKEQLENSDRWLIIIRLKDEPTFPDFLENLANNNKPERSKDSSNSINWDANAYWVEKLQMLLYISQVSTFNKVNTPKIAVLHSCYDELNSDNTTPGSVLEQRLPLVSSFLVSNWHEDSLSIWGLSALGRELTQDSKDSNFIDEGPEKQGWVVLPNKTLKHKDSDLTLPIKWLLDD